MFPKCSLRVVFEAFYPPMVPVAVGWARVLNATMFRVQMPGRHASRIPHETTVICVECRQTMLSKTAAGIPVICGMPAAICLTYPLARYICYGCFRAENAASMSAICICALNIVAFRTRAHPTKTLTDLLTKLTKRALTNTPRERLEGSRRGLYAIWRGLEGVCFRPDKELTGRLYLPLSLKRMLTNRPVTLGVQDFVCSELGQKYIEPPPFDLGECYKEASVISPLIFVLSSGADPMADLLKLCEEMRMLKKFDQRRRFVLAAATLTSPSLVAGDHSANHAPPLRTVHLDLWSVVGVEAHFRRLHLTRPPPLRTVHLNLRSVVVVEAHFRRPHLTRPPPLRTVHLNL
eukprot:1191862-Prorocentrum_minimum.AAC.2